VAEIDGVGVVSLLKADGTMISAKPDDQLDGGWMIRSVSLSTVSAEYEGNLTEFVVYPVPDLFAEDEIIPDHASGADPETEDQDGLEN